MSDPQVRSNAANDDATVVFETLSEQPAADAPADAAPPIAHAAAPRRSGSRVEWSRDLRFMLVVLAAIVVLFLAFALLIAFSPTGAAISALAVIAAPIATMVAAYYGISLALRQVRDAHQAAESADARARAAEASSRESDAWAAQMESGLRVAVSKLRGLGQDTRDVERAAGTPDEFF
ncbi:hypothetical protein [Agromyces aerolatus]|uniref:hypothetical protein n=1 Tax=Agromyces sp. LY-1074 TaxID=3074080 RepID=UPI00285903B4|nr:MULTISPECIES: hypothetical protein [unclassified Agromyces]MDR5700047.1 hypothetical protein [Agromyces sp. LY-1074]MDR5706585.1 hypothetical protein [Agromyces sp. LY-1358]